MSFQGCHVIGSSCSRAVSGLVSEFLVSASESKLGQPSKSRACDVRDKDNKNKTSDSSIRLMTLILQFLSRMQSLSIGQRIDKALMAAEAPVAQPFSLN